MGVCAMKKVWVAPGGGEDTAQDVNQQKAIKIVEKNELPKNIFVSYNKYEKNKWKGTYDGQTPGTKAGSQWNNNPPQLPQIDSYGREITYREFDVNNKVQGVLRDSERFVRGSDGRVYYTPDHYITFYEIIE